MIEFRCANCNKLLGMIEGKAEIKCPKCKTMNATEWGIGIVKPLLPLQKLYNELPEGVMVTEIISMKEMRKRYPQK